MLPDYLQENLLDLLDVSAVGDPNFHNRLALPVWLVHVDNLVVYELVVGEDHVVVLRSVVQTGAPDSNLLNPTQLTR